MSTNRRGAWASPRPASRPRASWPRSPSSKEPEADEELFFELGEEEIRSLPQEVLASE